MFEQLGHRVLLPGLRCSPSASGCRRSWRELRGALREELVQLLDREPRTPCRARGWRSGARLQVALAHEADDEPVAVGQLGNVVGARDRLGNRLFHCSGWSRNLRGRPRSERLRSGSWSSLFLLRQALTDSRFLPAVGIAGPIPGIAAGEAARASRPTGT